MGRARWQAARSLRVLFCSFVDSFAPKVRRDVATRQLVLPQRRSRPRLFVKTLARKLMMKSNGVCLQDGWNIIPNKLTYLFIFTVLQVFKTFFLRFNYYDECYNHQARASDGAKLARPSAAGSHIHSPPHYIFLPTF